MRANFCHVRIWQALFGHGGMSDLSPLSGVKRKTSARREYFAF